MKVGPHGEENINSRKLIDICEYNNMKIANGSNKHSQVWVQTTRNLK